MLSDQPTEWCSKGKNTKGFWLINLQSIDLSFDVHPIFALQSFIMWMAQGMSPPFMSDAKCLGGPTRWLNHGRCVDRPILCVANDTMTGFRSLNLLKTLREFFNFVLDGFAMSKSMLSSSISKDNERRWKWSPETFQVPYVCTADGLSCPCPTAKGPSMHYHISILSLSRSARNFEQDLIMDPWKPQRRGSGSSRPGARETCSGSAPEHIIFCSWLNLIVH